MLLCRFSESLSALLLLAALAASGARASVTPRRCTAAEDPRDRARVTILSAHHCNISDVQPADLNGLPNLTQIRLDHNQIQHLNLAGFRAVNGIESLSLGHNKLTEVPNFGELSLFPNMTKLQLNKNQISKLDDPKVFSSLVNLQSLDLRSNRIDILHPDVFKALTNLRSISLDFNKITHLSDKVFHIKSLENISLVNNLISHVAPGAINSGKLKKLDIFVNRLAYLPEHFVTQLKNASIDFTFLNLLGNPLQCGCEQELKAEAASTGAWVLGPTDCKPAADGQPACDRPNQEKALAPFTEHTKTKQ